MQRYRINLHLVIGLVVAFFVFGVGAYFLRAWQVGRKAGSYRELAEQEMYNGNTLEAFSHQKKYVLLRPKEEEALIELANIGLEVLKNREALLEDKWRAYSALEEAVRRTSDPTLRKTLAEMIISDRGSNRVIDGLNHVEELLLDDPDDPELLVLQVRGLYAVKDYKKGMAQAARLLGFDLKEKKFIEDEKNSSFVRDKPEVYSLLAYKLLEEFDSEEAVKLVMDRMVEENPSSHLAYLQKAELLFRQGEKEEAVLSLEKAYELDPEDAGVLQKKGQLALQDRDYEKAEEVFAEAVEKHPERILFYRLLAISQYSQLKTDAALATIEKGILRFGNRMGVELLLLRIEFDLEKENFAGVQDTIKDIDNLNQPLLKPVTDFARANITFLEGDIASAAKDFKRLRPLLLNHPSYKARAALKLAECYEKLGKPDQALATYELLLRENPGNALAERGKRRVLSKLRIGGKETQKSLGLEDLVKATLALPEEEQKWDKIDEAIDKLAEERGISELQQLLFRMNVFLMREMPAEAAQLLTQAKAIDPEDSDVRFAEVSVLALDPDQGPQLALELLDRYVAEEGVSFRSRSKRIALILSAGLDDKELVQELMKQAEGIEGWADEEQLKLCSMLAAQLQQLGKIDEARLLWKKASKLNPSYLPLRMQLFTLALQQKDDAAVEEIQKGILDLVKDPEDPSYLLTQVQQFLSKYVRQQIDREELLKARKLLDKALEQREQWHLLHIAYGKLLTVLKTDLEVALEHFEEALEYGPPDATAVLMQIGILEKTGQYKKALKRAELLSPAVRERVLGKTEASLLLKLGKREEAYETAKQLADVLESDDKTQAWFAGFARETEHNDEAIQALHRALEINPSVEQYWYQLANLYFQEKNIDKVRETLTEAQFQLDAESIPRLMAQQYVYMGQLQIAETIYKGVFEKEYDKTVANRKMAEFYLLWSRIDESMLPQAFPYINQILREYNEGRADISNPNVIWAREKAVIYLASTKDYQNAVKAEKLLEAGAIDGKLRLSDQKLLGEILTTQRDPKSLWRAIDIFEQVREEEGFLDKKHTLMLARMLNQTDNWKRCEELLIEATARYPRDYEIGSSYVNMLIDRGDYETATGRLNGLRNLDPSGPITIELTARLYSERGLDVKLRKFLKSLTPSMRGAIDKAKLDVVQNIAGLATRHKDYEYAEELYRFYVSRLPQEQYNLIAFLALHGDAEEAVALMQKHFKDNVNGVLITIVRMLRERRAEIGDQFDEAFNEMMDYALRDDPDSIARLAMQAELLEAQEQYSESIDAYDSLLQRDDLSVAARATCLNNLGFLLSLKERRLDEASEYIEEAMHTYGPVDDMLDTRAVLRMARKEYDLAVEDMTLATSVRQDPIMHYHLAKAHFLAGNKDDALQAWDEALELGFEMQDLAVPERGGFPAIEKQLEALRSQRTSL